ncbi:MAG: hypothetical protein MZV65_31215 [Chromatiales bacterium]|nr:hypothetical protein [Chromatiales bacterium]
MQKNASLDTHRPVPRSVARQRRRPGFDTLLSQVVLEGSTEAPRQQACSRSMATRYHLQREVIEDAHALTAVIDACGKAGHGDIGATLCLRSSHYLDQAWEIARQHRVQRDRCDQDCPPAEGCSGRLRSAGRHARKRCRRYPCP